jgi:uncharacterized protein YndB with AHSA1/START domain
MKSSGRTLEFKLERRIQAAPKAAYKAWLDPKVSGNPWNIAVKLLWSLKVNGFFCLRTKNEYSIYGRFTQLRPYSRIQHTWVSPVAQGAESLVTVSFKKQGKDSLMTLVHSGLPNNDGGREHEIGWNYFLDNFQKRFEASSRKKKQ